MNDNLNVVFEDFSAMDGRWDDDNWVANQASISAMCDSIENGREIG
jgi:hypothetical protein